MSKNIVLLSDGTGQRGGAGYETNVWRLFQTLKEDDQRQLVCYDDGVGSQRFNISKVLGGATGMGQATNVRELYTFLARHWSPGDRVYMFGFSRGAFTVRLLADMVARCGLLDLGKIESEQGLYRLAKAAYCACQSSYYKPAIARRFKDRFSRDLDVPIHFLGVWDTVGAIGIPFAEVRYAVHNLMDYGFRGDTLNPSVARACQALSIDDCRKTFHPLLWDERLGRDRERIRQVWFAGVHSNVGGGYPKRQMALVSLAWMIEQVRAWDAEQVAAPSDRLSFHQSEIERIDRERNVHGHLYDSRQIFRYQPRELERMRRDYTNEGVKLHESVFSRIRQVTDLYSPHNLGVHSESPLLRGPDGKTLVTARWRKAMAAARRVSLLQQGIYYAMAAATLAALCVLIPWPGLSLGFWAVLASFGGLALGLSKLRRWQTNIASAGWATLFPDGRAPGDAFIDRLAGNPILKLAKKFESSAVPAILSGSVTLGMFVAVFALSPLIHFGRKFHHWWIFSHIDRRELEVPRKLAPATEEEILFQTNMHRMRTGLLLEGGRRYEIQVEEFQGWRDKDYPADPNGLRRQLPAFMRKAARFTCLPGERIFCLLATIGDSHPIKIGMGTTLTADRTGELSLFVNDVAIDLPVFRELFYINNRGVARIKVRYGDT
ncbi:MAG: hypothetical protein A2514_03125 [Gammaproteobacteria bacterium RIFOXYD12_FULL_61_37]|nr:MAG: hypothetical protein A2514_03125 [Gammaproteobacteria bacterium RIFOXYD12_FULL_61_37]